MLIDKKSLHTGCKEIDVKIDRILYLHEVHKTMDEDSAIALIDIIKNGNKHIIEADKKAQKAIKSFNVRDFDKDVDSASREIKQYYNEINNGIIDDFEEDEDLDQETTQSKLSNSFNKYITPTLLVAFTASLANRIGGTYIASAENTRMALEAYAKKASVELSQASDYVLLGKQYIQDNFYSKGTVSTILDNYKGTLSSKLETIWTAKEGRNWKEVYKEFKDVLKDTDMEDYQVERIVRTEMAQAATQSSLQSAKESGLELDAEFVVSPDSCDACQELAEGNPYDINDIDVGDLPHPNCEDTWVFIPKETEETSQEDEESV